MKRPRLNSPYKYCSFQNLTKCMKVYDGSSNHLEKELGTKYDKMVKWLLHMYVCIMFEWMIKLQLLSICDVK